MYKRGTGLLSWNVKELYHESHNGKTQKLNRVLRVALKLREHKKPATQCKSWDTLYTSIRPLAGPRRK